MITHFTLIFAAVFLLHPFCQNAFAADDEQAISARLLRAIDNPHMVINPEGHYVEPEAAFASAYDSKVPSGGFWDSVMRMKNEIKRSDGSYYLRSGSLTAHDTRLYVAKRQADDFYNISTFQITNGHIRRATICKSPVIKRNSESKYDCYISSKDICEAVVRNAAKLVDQMQSCEQLTAQLEKALNLGTIDLEYYSQREVRAIQNFIDDVIPGKSDKGLNVDFSPAAMKRKARTRSALALYADFNETLEQCHKFHPNTVIHNDKVKNYIEKRSAPANRGAR